MGVIDVVEIRTFAQREVNANSDRERFSNRAHIWTLGLYTGEYHDVPKRHQDIVSMPSCNRILLKSHCLLGAVKSQ